jgi:hypothetical protein
MKKLLTLLGALTLAFSMDTTTEVNPNTQVVTPTPQSEVIATSSVIPNTPILRVAPIITLMAVGEGVAPINSISPAQARALARRAAIADAYRVLGEKMYGIRLSAKETVKDMVLKHSEIRTQVYGIVKGAKIEEESFQEGLYTVTMEVKLDASIWQKYLSK